MVRLGLWFPTHFITPTAKTCRYHPKKQMPLLGGLVVGDPESQRARNGWGTGDLWNGRFVEGLDRYCSKTSTLGAGSVWDAQTNLVALMTAQLASACAPLAIRKVPVPGAAASQL